MPPRPAVKGKDGRPVSAIYLGSANKHTSGPASGGAQAQASPPSSSSHILPDLPSPSSSQGSSNSGLPSPPATNSTGSGSTGDPGSVARRQRPSSFASDSSASTSSGSHKTMSDTYKRSTAPSSSRSSSRLADVNDFGDDNDNDNDLDGDDGDDTARLDRLHHAKSSNENARALQRVMSLTQRNRMAIDKLTRLGSPSPTPRSRSPVTSNSSSTSSSRLRHIRTVSQSTREQGLSGSETERESTSVQSYSLHSQPLSSHASSSQRPITPPSKATRPHPSSPYNRLRNISAPDSPNKARLLNAASGTSNSSSSPTSRQRKRASMATMTSITQNHEVEDDEDCENRFGTGTGAGRDRRRDKDTVRDITKSALAAVASSRRSPLGTRRRGALPREFREDLAGLANADTASIASYVRTRRSEHLSRPRRLSIELMTPYRNSGGGRPSTVGEVRQSGGTSRWVNEDYRNVGSPEASPTEARERRQAPRGGSAESALGMRSPGRTLIGEGLRAAGLTKKEDTRDVIGGNPGDVFYDKRSNWSPGDPEEKVKRRAVTYSRAATSMANYRYHDPREDAVERERGIRTHRSTYSLAEGRDLPLSRKARDVSLTRTERDQLGLDNNNPALQSPLRRSTHLPLAKAIPQHLQERHQSASPLGIKRQSTPTPGSGEHSRLMVESLSAFESVITKIPVALGTSSFGSIPSNSEMLKHAQVLVAAADRVNNLMRHGAGRALDEQIHVEVEEDYPTSGNALDVWKQVGGEYREGLRASDELVRSITSFLMGTGAVMRKLASTAAMSEFGSPSLHARSVSLDEEGVRQNQRSADTTEEASGRRSVERRSWEPALRQREREREETLRKLGGGGSGRESSLSLARASPALLSVRERDKAVFQTPSPLSGTRPLPPAAVNSSVRRLFVPGEQPRPAEEETDISGSDMRPSDSQQTLQGTLVEPSPTPVSRTIGRDRGRTLPSVQAAPKSEPTRRAPPTSSTEGNKSVRDRTADRRKHSIASISTIRGTGPSFSSLTTPSSATTGISHHTVSSSPQESWLPRSNSDKSARSTVTFSQPSTVSVSAALSGIQQQAMNDERRRTNELPQQQDRASGAFKSPAKLNAPGMSKADSDDPKRRTFGARSMRMSLDGLALRATAIESPSANKNAPAHAADRSAVLTVIPNGRKERRRTVTDIWPTQ